MAPSWHCGDPFLKKLYTERWRMEGNLEIYPDLPGMLWFTSLAHCLSRKPHPSFHIWNSFLLGWFPMLFQVKKATPNAPQAFPWARTLKAGQPRSAAIAEQIEALAALAEDLSLVPSIPILTVHIHCNPSSRCLPWLSTRIWGMYMHSVHIHIKHNCK